MCINISRSNTNLSDEMSIKDYELLKQIYNSINDSNSESTKSLTEQLILNNKENQNIEYLKEAINNLK
ncbi:hypothetical protein [Paraclostridium bifermentans]|uniref:hypothetical protein n=1 Tax=Paraclostridium bifermentans TaxID=1490 RepID=UPI00359C97EA